MTDEKQVACDALRMAGLGGLADNLDWAVEAVAKKQDNEAREVRRQISRRKRQTEARAMLAEMSDDARNGWVHQMADSDSGGATQCGMGAYPFAPSGKTLITCPACLHVLFGPGTDGR